MESDAWSAVVNISALGADICLGSLIADGWVLTAKHCVMDPGASEPVALDELRVSHDLASSRVLQVYPLGGEYEGLATLSGRDVALLRLSRVIGSRTAPVARELPEGLDVACAVGAVGPLEIEPAWIRTIESRSIFTDGVTCGGDSGGPLLDHGGSIIGIASWRTLEPCGEGTSAFTRADVHRAWIEGIVQ